MCSETHILAISAFFFRTNVGQRRPKTALEQLMEKESCGRLQGNRTEGLEKKGKVLPVPVRVCLSCCVRVGTGLLPSPDGHYRAEQVLFTP